MLSSLARSSYLMILFASCSRIVVISARTAKSSVGRKWLADSSKNTLAEAGKSSFAHNM